MKRSLLSALLVLAACGTPQEQCINSVTRDMRVVDRLVKEAEGNIARGYAFEEVTVWVTRWEVCGPPPPPPAEGEEPQRPRLCLEDVPQTTRRAVAIDLAAEASKLKGLKAKRAELARAAAPAIEQCKVQHPE